MALSELSGDLRLAFRMMAKSPGATALAVLSIGLGIGLTTSLFAVGDAFLLRPLAVEKPHELLEATSQGDDGQTFQYGWLDYQDMARSVDGQAVLVAYTRRGATLGEGEDSEMAITHAVTANYFSVLGVKALAGRASVGAAGGLPEAVLGYKLWQRRFGGDPQVVGRTVRVNRKAFVVAGVMPESFVGLMRGVTTEIWISTDAWFHVLGGAAEEQSREGEFEVVARLRQGVTPARAAAQMDAAIRGAEKHKAAPRSGWGTLLTARFAPGWEFNLMFGGGLVAVLALVLFVACANVAQLRLAQAEARKKELGVRIALGASGWRLTRQLLTETAVLSVAGAGLGIWLAHFLLVKISQFMSSMVRYVDYGFRLDYRVLTYVAGALVLATLFSGLAPTRHAVKLNIAEVLKLEQGSVGRRHGWQQRVLIVAQMAVSVVLFGMAVLFVTSLHHAAQVRPGIDPRKKLLVLEVGPGLRMNRGAWCEQACERLSGLPGVRGATYARRLPLSGSGGGMTARVEVPGAPPLGVPLNNVGGNYFSLMGTRVLAGRGIESGDREGTALVAVVSRTFARTVFGERNPLGSWVSIDGRMRQVVGIAEDGPSNSLHEDAQPFLYLPYAQSRVGGITLMVETASEPMKLNRAARAELRRFDPQVRIDSSTTLRETIDASLAEDRVMADVTGGLGVFGVLLTAAGLFGVLQYAVTRRAKELGLRMALGARPAEIQRMVLGESLRMAMWGVPIGLAMLGGAAWYARTVLLGVGPLDAPAYVLSATAAAGLALAAAWLPARRATRVDPMAALRME